MQSVNEMSAKRKTTEESGIISVLTIVNTTMEVIEFNYEKYMPQTINNCVISVISKHLTFIADLAVCDDVWDKL